MFKFRSQLTAAQWATIRDLCLHERQHPLNQRPLSIRELLKPRHVSSVSARTLNLSGTHRGGRERRLPFWRTC